MIMQVQTRKIEFIFDSYYDSNSNDDTFHDAVQGMQQIDDQANYDTNSDDNNEFSRDTSHDSIQAGDMIDDTYNDDDDVNRKPINNVIDHGEQRLTLYIINYVVSEKLEWSLKSYRVDNIKFNQKKENKEDQVYWKPDPLDRLNSISSMPDLLDHLDSISSNPDPLKRTHSPQGMLSLIDPTGCCVIERKDGECPDPELKRTHSPQEMLSLIDTTGCYVMKRKDGECLDPEVKLYHQGVHQQRYLGKPVGDMYYVWGDNVSMSNSPTVPEVA